MNALYYHRPLQSLWEKAVSLYQAGKRGSETYFSTDETQFLESIGLIPQEVYDYAEDFCQGGDPDLATFLLVHHIRRHYFLHCQNGQQLPRLITSDRLPAKEASLEGIPWLPRILAKTKAKLRGELAPELMYGCGGDRDFLKTWNFHPADFLQFVADHENDEIAIVQHLKKSRPSPR